METTDTPLRGPGALRRLADALLTTDAHQRLRIAMAGLASLLLLCCIVAMHIVAAAGLADARQVWWWTAFSASGMVVVYGLIRSGWSLRLADPSLTLWQLLYAISCNAVAYVIAGPARGIAPPILAVILMFGMFGLTPRQMLAVMFYAIVTFGIATGVSVWQDGPEHSPSLGVAYSIIILVVLLAGTFLTTRVEATRRRLQQQKHELAEALEQIRQMATHDELTGLINRRHATELMQAERDRSERSGRPMVVALVDLDHFKAINDTLGHATGDRALQAFARTAQQSVRRGDVVARWGGEEFVLLLCDTPTAAADALLERLRLAVAAAVIPGAPADTRLSMSAGVARRAPGESVELLMERVDRALYGAKSGGRNRVAWAATAPQDSATSSLEKSGV